MVSLPHFSQFDSSDWSVDWNDNLWKDSVNKCGKSVHISIRTQTINMAITVPIVWNASSFIITWKTGTNYVHFFQYFRMKNADEMCRHVRRIKLKKKINIWWIKMDYVLWRIKLIACYHLQIGLNTEFSNILYLFWDFVV